MGTCTCGDSYCPSCGDPILAAVEAAEETAMDSFADAKLTPDEYAVAAAAWLRAVGDYRAGFQASLNQAIAITRETFPPEGIEAEAT